MTSRGVAILLLVSLLAFGCVESKPSGSNPATPAPSVTAVIPSTPLPALTADAEFKNFQNDQFSIRYPESWTVQESDALVLFNSPTSAGDTVSENVNVLLVPTQKTLEAFTQEALGPVFQTEGTVLLDSSPTELSGKAAQKITYTEENDDGKLQYLQVISVQEGLAVLITYTATPATFETFRPFAENMISSFSLKTGTKNEPTPSSAKSAMAPEVVRKWRVYSEAIYYDSGGHNFLETPATTLLELRADQTWSFGSSTGTWSVQPIEESDWQKWGVSSYGPTRKLVLNGWNGQTNDGPIEESQTSVDFMWVIYRTGPPAVSSPGQIQMKFGQTYG